MHGIDNQKFSAFLLRLRKEHGMTQKELAEKLLPGQAGAMVLLSVLLAAVLGGLFIPVYVLGRKYE